MLVQLEKQFLQADLAQVLHLLAQGHAYDDPIAIHQYGQRVELLERELAELSRTAAHEPLAVALFFGGRAVIGAAGINASFGIQAVGKFRKLIGQRYAAAEAVPSSSYGRMPMSDGAPLMVTDVVSGSFGFVLQGDQAAGSDPRLKEAVDHVADTVSRMAAADDASFSEISTDLDGRQLATLKEFFKLLDDEGASLRVVEGERDFELTPQAVQRARRRAEAMTVKARIEI